MEFCSVSVKAGDTAIFWSDRWHGQVFSMAFPRLFSFALEANMSVREVVQMSDLSTLFALPLSVEAFAELQSLEIVLSQVLIHPNEKDEWRTIWKDGSYSSKKYYLHCFKDIRASRVHDCIWKCKVLHRIKVFAWLLLSDRLNTRDMIRRRHWNVTNVFHCVLCPSHITEDWTHLFFKCPFSIRIWNYLQIQWEDGNSFQEVFSKAMRSFNQPFFTEVVILACWHIWKQRNEAIFQQILPSFRAWRSRFIHEATLHTNRMKAKHVGSFSAWISSLV
jgi:hypothetical protein